MMQILYAVTLCEPNNPVSGLLHKLKLLASNQVEALKLASDQARERGLVVCRVEELQVVKDVQVSSIPNLALL